MSSKTVEEIKHYMAKYNEAQRASCEAIVLRKKLVPMIKSAGLTKTKFNFGDREIKFHTYNDYENITQKMIKKLIAERYPQIKGDKFIEELYAMRKCKTVDTLRASVASRVSRVGTADLLK